MEFNQDLSAFQGVLISADNVYRFSDLSSRGGNLDNIKSVVNILKTFLQSRKFLDSNGFVKDKLIVLHKFAFYVILNSDINILSEMVEMEGIDTVIWTIPTIPKCLMCEIIWGLKMDMFLYDIITYTNPKLSLEVAAAFVENMKYFTPSEFLGKAKLITAALYKLICRLHFYKYDNIQLSVVLTNSFTLFQKCLKFYVEPPNSDKLKQYTEDELYTYIGNCLHSLLLLIDQCLDSYTQSIEYNCSDEIYSLTCGEELLSKDTTTFKMCESPVALIKDCLMNSNNELLDKCKAVVMEVSVDIFCSWSEYDLEGKSIQETIGETCYNVLKKVTEVSILAEHPLVGMLQQISRKPADYKDMVNSTDRNVIIEKVNNNNPDKVSWLTALVHKDNLCQDLCLVQLLDTNLALLSEGDCKELYYKTSKHISDNASASEEVKVLALKAFKNISEIAKFNVLEEHFSNRCLKDNEWEGFSTVMTEVFNKLIATQDGDISDILCLFLQNPRKVYDKIFQVASESAQQSKIMIRVIKYLGRFSDHFYNSDTEACVIKVAQKYFEINVELDDKQNNFLHFIVGLKTENIIPSTKLLLLIIMPNLHKGLMDKNVSSINSQLKLLELAYTVEELMPYRAPMLAMIGQVLEATRWKMNTFNTLAPETIKIALKIQKTFFETYKSTFPEKESIWLKNKLKNLQPLNQYYYKELWNVPGETFLDVIVGKQISTNMNLEDLYVPISKILCSSVQEEWVAVCESLSVLGEAKSLDLVHKAVIIAAAAEKVIHSDNTWSCVLHLYRNFIFVVRYNYFKEPVPEHQITEVFIKIASTIDIMEEDRVGDLVTIICPLLSFVIEKYGNQFRNVLTILRLKVRHRSFLYKICQTFTNGS